MSLRPQMRELGIVLLGDFNPAILQPAWFAAEDLIRPNEATDAKVDVVHRELAAFELPWMRLEATTDRFQVTTAQEPYFPLLRDLVVGILTLLEHTPIRAYGINWTHYYSLPDRSRYDKFGHAVVPKDFWKPVFSDPRTLRVAVRELQEEGSSGYIDTTISPSTKFPFCVHMFINDHSDTDPASKVRTTVQVRDSLTSAKWEKAESRPSELSKSLFANFI